MEEGIGVSACLDQLLRALHHVEAVLHTTHPSQQPPTHASHVIAEEKEQGIARFGQSFADGDSAAVVALQHLTICLQASLLDSLTHPADHQDHHTHLTSLTNALAHARTRAAAVLSDFRQRLNASQQPDPATSPVVNPPQGQLASSTACATDSSPAQPASAAAADDDAVPGAEAGKQHRKKSHILHFLKPHHRANSSSDSPTARLPTVQEPPRRTSASPARIPFRPPSQPETVNQNTPELSLLSEKYIYAEWEDDPREIWGKRSLDRRDTVALAPDQSSSTSSSTPTGPTPSSPPPQPPSPVLTTRSNSTQHTTGSLAIPMPNSENDFLGFCRSAVKVQNGDRKGAMNKSREVEAWSRHQHATSAMFLSCSAPKCAFRSAFATQDPGRIWTRVFTLESKGMKVRWQFLAKSHVLQRVVVKHQYSFLCLFCTFLGEKSGIYHGMDYYLHHINAEHRGKQLSQIALYKTGCIAERIAADDEDFDINLWPLSVGRNDGRRRSDWLSEETTGSNMTSGNEPNDSMFSAEPWNEGLSDFHTGTEFDGGNEWAEIGGKASEI